MTRTQRPFPIAFRLLATACALLVLAVSATAASADDPTKQDVIDARQAKNAAKDRLDAQRDELAAIQARLTEQAFEVDRIEGLVEQTRAELLDTQQRIDRNAARYDGLRAQLNDRAAEAFMDGPGSNLDLVLDASSFSELSDRLEFVDAVNASDASLAQQVANIGYELGLDEERLTELQKRQKAHAAAARELRVKIQDELQRAEELKAQLTVEAEEYADKYAKTQKAYEELLESISVSSHSTVPMPEGWAKVL
jgi:peptidoglycan DL-endopeptidase CwlO